ncbi:hypothetical protein HYX07_03405 [Candidatus Woesearchaeota archaeon]|nr:hypothetical protein [Candidatus Woesearchaeota archaeon]
MLKTAERPRISERYSGDRVHALVQMPHHGDPQERVILRSFDLTRERPELPPDSLRLEFVGTNDDFGRVLDNIVKESAQTMRPFTPQQLTTIADTYLERGY